MVIRRIRTRTP